MKTRPLLLSILLLLGVNHARIYAQYIDSLKALIPTLSGVSKVDAMIDLCDSLDFSPMKTVAKEALPIAIEVDYLPGAMYATRYIGHSLLMEDSIDKAGYWYQRSVDYALQTEEPAEISIAYNYLAMYYVEIFDYVEALRAADLQEFYAKQSAENEMIAQAWWTYSMVYHLGRDEQQVAFFLLKILEILKEDHFDTEMAGLDSALIYTHLALNFESLGQTDSAAYYYQQADHLYEQDNLGYSSRTVFKPEFEAYYGAFLNKVGKYDQAKTYCSRALLGQRELQVETNVANCWACLSEAYFFLGEQEKAAELLDSALTIGRKWGENRLLYEIYRVQYEQALDALSDDRREIFRNYENYKDSIINIDRTKGLLKLIARQEQEKSALEISSLQEKVSLERRISILTFLLFVGLLAFGGLLYRHYRSHLGSQKLKVDLLEAKNRNQEQLIQAKKMEVKLAHRQKQYLEERMSEMERNLIGKTLQQAEIDHFLEKVSTTLNTLSKKGAGHTVEELKRFIEVNRNKEQDWEEFSMHFQAIHPEFFDKLKDYNPRLSQNDLRLCAYIKLNLNTKEIARLLNISPNSVNTSKYRLKKKIGFDPELDFYQFIASL